MLAVNYCGYQRHNPDGDVIYRPNGLDSYLFILVLAPINFTNSTGRQQVADSGACILFEPGVYQNYQAEKKFINSFVEFSKDDQTVLGSNLPKNQLFYPQNYSDINQILQRIQREFLSHDLQKEELMDLYIKELLILANRGLQEKSYLFPDSQDLYQNFETTRLQMLQFCNESWSAERLCQILQVGKSRLYAQYRDFFHTTPREDLINARLNLALNHMSNHSMTIQEAAYQAGFQNINHFHRLFKKRFGKSPAQYRKQRKISI